MVRGNLFDESGPSRPESTGSGFPAPGGSGAPPSPGAPPDRSEGDASFISVARVVATIGILVAIMGVVFVLVWALGLVGPRG